MVVVVMVMMVMVVMVMVMAMVMVIVMVVMAVMMVMGHECTWGCLGRYVEENKERKGYQEWKCTSYVHVKTA
jgi:hypothetical protein